MATKRRCLKIPFVISATNPDAIIGNSCADNPAWEVPCTPADLEGVLCVAGDLPAPAGVSANFPPDLSSSVSLPEPTVKVLTLA